ncbi:DUF6082 family protein [Streptomyces bicolor]|uniref:DUF6082 family protein n=1 Tax=Streptomyces bicolor TaxID=66874 RepID=UPI00056AA7F8|nr:DUF6082 family protein [Streptomyces bicolor]
MPTLMPPLRRIGLAMRAGFRRRRHQEELVLGLVRELARLRSEIHYANLIQYHRLVMEQSSEAMDDPALGETLSTLKAVTERQRRQLLFANREYATVLLAHRIGLFDWDELIGHLRVLSINPVFADYWRRTAEHRLSLPHESLEATVGRAVDVLMEELADDPDEWWVVGDGDGPQSPDSAT